MNVHPATDRTAWDSFLQAQPASPFLQSWAMGEVHRRLSQEPLRFVAMQDGVIAGIAQGIVIPARRGRHVAVSYGPVTTSADAARALLTALQDAAREHRCSFVRVSPFWNVVSALTETLQGAGGLNAPLHLLAEHLWYLPLRSPDPWQHDEDGTRRSEEELLAGMRKTMRNLIRRAERDGVTVEASKNPLPDLRHFLTIYDETRKRHGFTPYSDAFIRAQVEEFSSRGECTLYLAWFEGEVISASVHMHLGGETSYHHGASTARHAKVPASYLLQWTAIRDALHRGDHIYNFWGISPEGARNHPFAGVTTFKKGFGGASRTLTHCMDLPLSPRYHATRAFEFIRKWRRGF